MTVPINVYGGGDVCLPGYVDRRPVWCLVELVRPSVLTVVVVVEAMQYSKANKAKEDAPQMIMKL